MRVAVVGATGNSGTAILRQLGKRPEVTSVLGIARRLPNTSAEPYSSAEWFTCDVSLTSSQDQLTEALRGADALIHLAWLIQPNDQRELLRRVNVEGTRLVLEAATEAGVSRITVASSVGAYSPVDDDELRNEDWPTEGIPSSHYSVDKADQERVLDEFEASHPDIALARIRAALKFQADAGFEIQRYFLGQRTPVQLLQAGKLPLLPLPRGIRAQGVHSDDVAAAYVEAALQGARGAFNICADDILRARELSAILDHGRSIPLPPRLVRTVMAVAHRTGVIPADAGWLDMAMRVPMMDNTRAKEELGWSPRKTGAEALEELVEGMVSGQGGHSVPMRPRDVPQEDTHPLPERSKPEDSVDSLLLRQYLSDHYSGATAGLKRIQRMSASFVDTPVFAEISEVAEELRKERAYLRRFMKTLNLTRPLLSPPMAWVAEKAGRLKPNGRLSNRSPSSMVLESELMSMAVTGKLRGWQTLQAQAPQLGTDPEVFSQLIEAAEHQLDLLEKVHSYARELAFRKDVPTFAPDAIQQKVR